MPKRPHQYAPVKVLARVQLPAGTYFVVKSLEDKQINRTRKVSYKNLLAQYRPADNGLEL